MPFRGEVLAQFQRRGRVGVFGPRGEVVDPLVAQQGGHRPAPVLAGGGPLSLRLLLVAPPPLLQAALRLSVCLLDEYGCSGVAGSRSHPAAGSQTAECPQKISAPATTSGVQLPHQRARATSPVRPPRRDSSSPPSTPPELAPPAPADRVPASGPHPGTDSGPETSPPERTPPRRARRGAKDRASITTAIAHRSTLPESEEGGVLRAETAPRAGRSCPTPRGGPPGRCRRR